MYYCVHVHMGVHACKCVCLLESVNVNHLWYGMWKAEPNILLHNHMPISTEQLLGKISLADFLLHGQAIRPALLILSSQENNSAV